VKLSTSSGGHRAERDLRRTRRARVRAHRRQGSWACIVAGAALCATFISGASAAQTLRFTFTGRGWGHGVGMSQYGAEGDAAHGWSAAKILAWYFRGTTLAKTSTKSTVRVLMSSGQRQLTIGVRRSGELINAGSGQAVAVRAGTRYLVRPSGAGLLVTTATGATVDHTRAGLRVMPTGAGLTVLGSRAYRGELSIASHSGRLTAINTVPIESYVQGVVAMEIPSRWAPAALQAQAIAARSFALSSREPRRAFDLYPDSRSQDYGGVAAQTARTNAAVGATAGTVVAHHGAIAQTDFFDSSGGHTESAQDVWGGSAVSYLVGVPDPYDTGSGMDPWRNPPSFSAAQLGQRLGLGGPVTKIAVLRRGASPRVMLARVTLASGRSVTLSGDTIEADLGLHSTWFAVVRTPPVG
jgi:stage II sporulation protein D